MYPFFPPKQVTLEGIDIQKIFRFLGNFNNLLWSMGKRETAIEVLTIQMTSALNVLRQLRRYSNDSQGVNPPEQSEDRAEITDFGLHSKKNSFLVRTANNLQLFRQESWALFGQYLSLKFSATLNLVLSDQLLSDKVVSDVIKSGFFGDRQVVES